MEILGNARKSPRISENFGSLQTRFWKLKRLMKLLENFGNSSKVFSRCSIIFLNIRKIFGKSSEVFGKIRKRFKSNFQMLL